MSLVASLSPGCYNVSVTLQINKAVVFGERGENGKGELTYSESGIALQLDVLHPRYINLYFHRYARFSALIQFDYLLLEQLDGDLNKLRIAQASTWHSSG